METEQKDMGIDPRLSEDLVAAFNSADYLVRKRYRSDLSKCEVLPIPEPFSGIEVGSNIQVFRIDRIVYDPDENNVDKLSTVYHSLSSFDNAAIIMILTSDKKKTKCYLGIAERALGEKGNNNYVQIDAGDRGTKCETLKKSFEANFPGSVTDTNEILDKKQGPINTEKLIDRLIDGVKSVASVTGIASLRNKDNKDNESFIQGIEKLIDAMQGKRYSAIFIADCKGIMETENLCSSYEDLYSQISPFLQSQQNIGRIDGTSETESFIQGVIDTTNESLASTDTQSFTEMKGSSNTVGAGVNVKLIEPVSISGHYSHSWTKSHGKTESKGKTITTGTAKSLSEQNSVAKAISNSTSNGLQITIQNRAVKTLMDTIDEQISHIRSCESYGVFDFSAYFLAPTDPDARAAASIYDSLMRGESSSLEVFSTNVWNGESEEEILKYLKFFYHPLILVPNLAQKKPQKQLDKPGSGNNDGQKESDNEFQCEPLAITPSSIISGRELALQMGLPRKSVMGIPIMECAEFGRNVISSNKDARSNISLGKIYHMLKEEKGSEVKLDSDSFSMHTFITGTTGTGKSNTIYKMLDQLQKAKCSFLVIEPAKGEYKYIFGNEATVYATNPNCGTLLKINPFSFPDEIHIYEHMDRLIEIFNACWPMYAAMPAVLKDAIERSYQDAGWDLVRSTNKYDRRLFPNFRDVLKNIDTVMEESLYSSDSKGDYKGALSTRVRSLTNGINGLIFCSEEEKPDNLFSRNVIVDLSRVGSVETKSLIMGMLIMKLQEYRMARAGMNEKLQHVTVIEEAHHLLRKTSAEQSSESANLAGKAVEMLTNAIAEMRTYGEGFIIADQAPGLLDPAVIRNTNTKMILRLPDYSDRELVGKSIGLNDRQISELAKLPQGVAAVYQNDWIAAVLCAVGKYSCNNLNRSISSNKKELKKNNLKGELISRMLEGNFQHLLEKIDDTVIYSDMPVNVKCLLYEYCQADTKQKEDLACGIAYELFNIESVCRRIPSQSSEKQRIQILEEDLQKQLKPMPSEYVNIILRLVIQGVALRPARPDMRDFALEYLKGFSERRFER